MKRNFYKNKVQDSAENKAFELLVKQHLLEFKKTKKYPKNIAFTAWNDLIIFINEKLNEPEKRKVWYSIADPDCLCYTSLTFDGVIWPINLITNISEIIGINLSKPETKKLKIKS